MCIRDSRNASDYLEEVNKQKEEKDEETERLEEMGKEQKEAQEEMCIRDSLHSPLCYKKWCSR